MLNAHSKVRAWMVRADIEVGQLNAQAKENIADLRRLNTTDEDGATTTWVAELVNGQYGRNTTRFFNEGFLGEYDEPTSEDIDTILSDFDELSSALADELNAQKDNMPGRYWVGHHEADGSIGIFYTEDEPEAE